MSIARELEQLGAGAHKEYGLPTSIFWKLFLSLNNTDSLKDKAVNANSEPVWRELNHNSENETEKKPQSTKANVEATHDVFERKKHTRKVRPTHGRHRRNTEKNVRLEQSESIPSLDNNENWDDRIGGVESPLEENAFLQDNLDLDYSTRVPSNDDAAEPKFEELPKPAARYGHAACKYKGINLSSKLTPVETTKTVYTRLDAACASSIRA